MQKKREIERKKSTSQSLALQDVSLVLGCLGVCLGLRVLVASIVNSSAKTDVQKLGFRNIR